MAENTPNVPSGPGAVPPPPPKPVMPVGATPAAAPPKPGESGKIQPKKETVRINLPPKPTAAPTIKIPAPSAISAAAPAVVYSGGGVDMVDKVLAIVAAVVCAGALVRIFMLNGSFGG